MRSISQQFSASEHRHPNNTANLSEDSHAKNREHASLPKTELMNKKLTGVVEEPGMNLRLHCEARSSDSKPGMRSRCASRHGARQSHTPAMPGNSRTFSWVRRRLWQYSINWDFSSYWDTLKSTTHIDLVENCPLDLYQF